MRQPKPKPITLTEWKDAIAELEADAPGHSLAEIAGAAGISQKVAGRLVREMIAGGLAKQTGSKRAKNGAMTPAYVLT